MAMVNIRNQTALVITVNMQVQQNSLSQNILLLQKLNRKREQEEIMKNWRSWL